MAFFFAVVTVVVLVASTTTTTTTTAALLLHGSSSGQHHRLARDAYFVLAIEENIGIARSVGSRLQHNDVRAQVELATLW